ncbi:Isochorismatase hydrolase [Melanomma pulvis-pyrius CBS 109.77]|uniref:Isochorismatase hydrolase n=1 Tax=Melanomma pulvis-pyrius CBS 109.77 TaxID=1314802 RepID=A0A6A6XRW7_9PLEO|nr:Isochorismatase hydrolase [Melanomma pulvis-pyrius CBS 109.77]
MTSQPRAALLIIDTQHGLTHPSYYGPSRSNPSFEANLSALLSAFRSSPQPCIIHVYHTSADPRSPLHPSNPYSGIRFHACAQPLPSEAVIGKTASSAFVGQPGTQLVELLRENRVRRLVVAGWALDHCVSSSVRSAADLEAVEEIWVVGDATAAFQKRADGVGAEVVQAVSLESLREFAEVVTVGEVLEMLGGGSEV